MISYIVTYRQCPSHIKAMCYKSMVRPILEYASSIWDPHTNANIQRLESIQRRAARFCLNDLSRYSSVTSMLSTLNLPSLQSRRKSTKLITMYKIINGDLHIPSNSLIPNPLDSRSGYFTQLQSWTDSCKFSFFPTSIKLWNFLPPLWLTLVILISFVIILIPVPYNHIDFCTVILHNHI